MGGGDGIRGGDLAVEGERGSGDGAEQIFEMERVQNRFLR